MPDQATVVHPFLRLDHSSVFRDDDELNTSRPFAALTEQVPPPPAWIQDLGLVIRGWTDARVTEAEREVQNLFTEAGLGITELGKKRVYQTQNVNKLKALKARSGIVGQEDANLWVQRDRSVEERLRIRAIVLAKNFYNALPLKDDKQTRWPDPEIVWRGQLFVGQVRTLKNMDDGHEPAAYDQIIEDVKGNHTVWFLCAESYAKITGRDKESLQQMWQDFRPSATPMGDHMPVWQQQTEELLQFCENRRYHDTICLCCDLNYDILDIVNVDERGVPLGQLLRTLNLEHTRPLEPTWRNTTGSASRIDFILFAMPSLESRDDRVVSGSDEVVGSDHCAVSIALRSCLPSRGRASFKPSKCGKWWTDGPALQTKAEQLAEKLDLSMNDLSMQDLEGLCEATSKRVTSCRYVDSPAIKDMIKARRKLRGREAQQMAKSIADARKTDKREWLVRLLEQSAAGDFRAAAYFRKRQSTMFVQGSYCMRAGGKAKAISDLRFFYQRKYTPLEPPQPGLPMATFHCRAGPIMNPEPFTLQEIQEVAFQCKHNKSTGADGISYEALQMLLQSDLSHHIMDMFNSVLQGDLRPIVLSSTAAKVFTKALMLRLRPKLPRLAEEYGKPLIIIKLDVAAAFDSLSHEAVAALLATAQGSREAELLLQIVLESRVELGLQGTAWEQQLRQGILQGSSYSAELFARCIDYFLTPTNARWQELEESWLKDPSGRKLFLTPFADDLVLLATSRAQAQRLLSDSEATLQAIGKVKYESTFLFLGILMGFQLTCLMILQARMAKVSSAFWAYYSILRRTEVGLTRRLRVFDCFITPRWRWISPAIRPISTVHRFLRTIHTSFLTAMLRFARDPFQGAVESWVARRRAARLAAQQVNHRAWPGEHSRQFFSFWGHAARYAAGDYIPIALMLQVRGPTWYFANRAADRDLWKAFSQDAPTMRTALHCSPLGTSPYRSRTTGNRSISFVCIRMAVPNRAAEAILRPKYPQPPYSCSLLCDMEPVTEQVQDFLERAQAVPVLSLHSILTPQQLLLTFMMAALSVLLFYYFLRRSLSQALCHDVQQMTGMGPHPTGDSTPAILAIQQSLQALDDTVPSLLTALQESMTALSGVVTNHGSLLGQLQQDVTSLTSTTTSHDSLLQQLDQGVKDIGSVSGTEISSLLKELGSLIGSLQQLTPAATTQFVKDVKGALETRMKTLQDTLMELSTSATALKTRRVTVDIAPFKEQFDGVKDQLASLLAKIDQANGYMRDDHALIVRIKDKLEETKNDGEKHKAALQGDIRNIVALARNLEKTCTQASDFSEKALNTELKNVVEESEKLLRWVAGQEEALADRAQKIESMCTGMVDQLTDVSTALENHSSVMGQRLRLLNEVQGGVERVLSALPPRPNQGSTTPMQPAPHMGPHGWVQRGPPPAPSHTPTVYTEWDRPSSSARPAPVIVTSMDTLATALQQHSQHM
ncbi:unnamed protein product [Symbiodinium sp. CCMP2592]|nr:unnamed protein product [Symbiodinium sp. CCMP2592]